MTKVTPYPYDCVECGATFQRERHRQLCSTRCRRSRVKRRRAAMFTQAERLAIFERDHWTCGICARAVDPNLTLPDLMSAAVDHVIPFALGGEHSANNAQCSHWICNSRKHISTSPHAYGVGGDPRTPIR